MRYALLLVTLLASSLLLAQPAISLEKAILEAGGKLAPERLTGVQWLPESDRYTVQDGTTMAIYNSAGKVQGEVPLAQLIGEDGKKFPRIHWISDEAFYYARGGVYFIFHWESGKKEVLAQLPKDGSNLDYHVESGNLAYTRGNNLFVSAKNDEQTVTNEEDGIVSGQAIARYEFGIGKGTFWSPKGNMLAFYQKDERHVTDYPLTHYTSVPPTVEMVKYPMAGSESEYAALGVFNVKSGKTIYLDFSQFGSKDEFYATNCSWSPDGKEVIVAVVNREQDDMQLSRFSAKDGKLVDVMYHEVDERYVEPESPTHFLPDGESFLWLTEKDGYNNILHLAYPSGELLGQTSADFPITSVLKMGPKGRSVFVQATGSDATQSHVFRVDLKTYAMIQLSGTWGVHNAKVSASGKYIIDRWSNLETPGQTDLIDRRGKVLRTLHRSKNPLQAFSYGKPEVTQIASYDGELLWSRIIKPSFFDDTKKYPVLVYVYNGPHAQMIDKRWMAKAPLWMYSLAEQGYIVYTVDGRGSANRGKDFEQAIFRNAGATEVLDQRHTTEWLKQQPYTDPNRFAIHGWSYGGFMTTSLMLKEPGLYKVGVAGGPVIDWSYYEVMYTERYMDTPETNPEGFRRSDLKNYVKELEGSLLMIHGAIDDVVVLQHNVDFQKTCIDQGVQVDFYMYPGHPHNVRGKDRIHLMQKVFDYLKLHL